MRTQSGRVVWMTAQHPAGHGETWLWRAAAVRGQPQGRSGWGGQQREVQKWMCGGSFLFGGWSYWLILDINQNIKLNIMINTSNDLWNDNQLVLHLLGQLLKIWPMEYINLASLNLQRKTTQKRNNEERNKPCVSWNHAVPSTSQSILVKKKIKKVKIINLGKYRSIKSIKSLKRKARFEKGHSVSVWQINSKREAREEYA